MNRKLLIGTITFIALAGFLTQFANVSHAPADPTIVVYAKGMLDPTKDAFLVNMQRNMTQLTWVIITDVVTFDKIKSADMILLVQVDTSQNYTNDELAALKQWFDQGGKVLWNTGDSDYVTDKPRLVQANVVQAYLGSKLRCDDDEPNDASRSPSGIYRIGVDITPDTGVSALADGVGAGMVLFHGPSNLAAIKDDGTWVNMTDKPLDNIYRIAFTGANSTVYEDVPPLPKAYRVGAKGRQLMMAAEVMRNNGIIVLSSEAPFDHYRGMWYTGTYYDLKNLQGQQFCTNVILWGTGLKGTKPTFQRPWTEYLPYVAAALVVVIVAVVAYFYMRRKP